MKPIVTRVYCSQAKYGHVCKAWNQFELQREICLRFPYQFQKNNMVNDKYLNYSAGCATKEENVLLT